MSTRKLRRAGVAALLIVTLAAALVGWLNVRGDAHFAGEASTAVAIWHMPAIAPHAIPLAAALRTPAAAASPRLSARCIRAT
jgi:hypothetical protein